MEVSEFEKKRADNLILNSARNYSLHPEFRVFDADGKAELYWNSVIGAVYRRQDREALQTLYRSFRGRRDQLLYESLFWIAELRSGRYSPVSAGSMHRKPLSISALEYPLRTMLPDGRSGSLPDTSGGSWICRRAFVRRKTHIIMKNVFIQGRAPSFLCRM